jgi:hypothetical protein
MKSQKLLARSAAVLLVTVGGAMGLSGATSAGAVVLNAPIVTLAATPDGHGYWEVAADGGVFAFGDAGFYGSIGGQHLNAGVVGLAATPDGHGYWEVAADGGVFAFGDASFYGSIGDTRGGGAVTGITGSPSGHGYWEAAADGGVFSYGDAGFYGSLGGAYVAPPPPPSGPFVLPSPWSCIAENESGGDPSTNTGNGYFGLFQFSIASWEAAGGPPGLPSNYSEAEQLQIAENLQGMQGWGAWPVTSRLCGV